MLMKKLHSEIALSVVAHLPMTVLFTLIAFIYTVYMTTYLVELIANDYDYQDQSQLNVNPAFLIVMDTVTTYSNSFVQNISGLTTVGSTDTQRKGIVFAVILHVIFVIFAISTIRAIKTNPGTVPEEWNSNAQREFSEVVEIEKRVLCNIRKQVKKRRKEEALEEHRKLLEEVKEEIVLESDLTPRNQGAIETFASDRDQVQKEKQQYPENEAKALAIENIASEDKEQEQIEEEKREGVNKENDDEEEAEGDTAALDGPADFCIELDEDDLSSGRFSKDRIHQLAVMSALKRENKRYCAHCQKFKPERAHHCRQCGVCVLKMDHHCPWIGTCVGFYNYKYFLNMVFYGDLMLLFVAVTYAEVVKDTVFNQLVSTPLLFVIILNYLVTLVLSIILTIFFIFHICLIISGKTTLEFCEKKRFTRYSFGSYGNLQRVLGRNILFWMLPCCPYTEGQGLYFN